MAKSSLKKGTLISEVANEALKQLAEKTEERLGGPPSQETNTRLEIDEENRPFEDTDIFSFCEKNYIEKGIGILYYVNKNFEQLCTEKHPMSWEKLQEKYKGGRYTVKAKNMNSGLFTKQESRVLADPPVEEVESSFHFGEETKASSSPSFAETLALMQQMNDRQEAMRREDREKSKEMLLAIVAAATPLLQAFISKPKEDSKAGLDPTAQLMLEFIKENSRSQQEQFKAILERMEKINQAPQSNPLDLMKQLQEAEDRGWNRRKEITEEIDEKAETRAAEMIAGQGEKDETLTETLIKTMMPVLGQIATQRAALPQMEAQEPIESLPPAPLPEASQANVTPLRPSPRPAPRPSSRIEPVRSKPTTRAATPPKVVTPSEVQKALTPKEQVLHVLVPYFGHALTQMANNQVVTAQQAVEESLQLLKQKGFSRDQLLVLFKREDMTQMIKQYGLPDQVTPWFNEYYAYLESQTRVDDRNPAPVGTQTAPAGQTGQP